MAGSRAAAEAQEFGYTQAELTFGHSVKKVVKKAFGADKDSTVDKIEEKNKKTKRAIDQE